MINRLGNAILLLSFVHASSAAAQTSSGDEAAIRAARERSNRAIAAHDVDGTVSMMAPAYVSVSSRNSRNVSRDEARREYASLFTARKGVVFVRAPARIVVNHDWGQAAEEGKWTGRWSAEGGAIRVGGVYFAKWVKMGADWQMLSETFVQTSCVGRSYCDAPPGG